MTHPPDSSSPANRSPIERLPWDVLDRYLRGEAPSDEVQMVETYFGDTMGMVGAGSVVRDELRGARNQVAFGQLDGVSREILAKVTPTLPQSGAPSITPKASRRMWRGPQVSRHNWRVGAMVGATVGVLGLVAVTLLVPMSNIASHKVSRIERTYSTTARERATVTLADGSRVTLGPSTTLRVSTTDGETNASATVQGEALFAIAHHARSAFTVHTGTAIIRVLGTTFSTRHYPSDRNTRVVVANGRVAVSDVRDAGRNDRAAILDARTLCVVSDSGSLDVVPNIAVDRAMAWTTGQLVFDNVPLRDAIADLGRAYDVEFRLKDSTLAKAPLTWTIATNNASLSAALDELGEVLEAHFTRSGRIITIVRGRPSSHRTQLRTPNPSFTVESQYGR